MVYNIGTGISDVTAPAIGQNMQGMADPSQKITGVESRLYARTFVITDDTDPDWNKPIVIVIADMWASVEAVKTEVIKRLKSQSKFHSLGEENVLISGTHTHSGPGGFSHSPLYEKVTGGFEPHTFECVVSGIIQSIQNALN